MKATDMDYQQVMDFTGFERRVPTEQEVELVVGFSAPYMFDQKAKQENIPISDQPLELGKLIQETKAEWMANSFVLDFKSVGKRLFYHHQIRLTLQDHEEIQQFFNQSGITPQMVETNSNTLGEEFKNAVKKATTPHNHIFMWSSCVLINADDKVIPQKLINFNICLHETQKKEKETKSSQENQS